MAATIYYLHPFNIPRSFSPEIVNFLLNADRLKSVTGEIKTLSSRISSSAIVNKLLVQYAYTKGNDPASLIYFSRRNINSIREFLSGKSFNGDFTDHELKVLENFNIGLGPEGFSTSIVESALSKVGIDRTTKIRRYILPEGAEDPDYEEVENELGDEAFVLEKVVNGGYLGADKYMSQALSNLFNKFIIRAEEMGRNCTMDNFRLSDFPMMVSISHGNLSESEYKMSDSDKRKYLEIVAPANSEFNKQYGSSIRTLYSTSTLTQKESAYKAAVDAQVDYNNKLMEIGDVDEQTKLQIELDSELQYVKISRLEYKLINSK